jgi:energy-coupling factor transporter ATP-binding protein EcfA2
MITSEITIPDVWQPLHRQETPLMSTVELSHIAFDAIRDFDFQTDGISSFLPYAMPAIPKQFGIGVIVGASGTGKSTLLAEFGSPEPHSWNDGAIVEHFETAKEAQEKFYAVGLTSIPTWIKPFQVLSNGEKFRAALARSLTNNAIIDEYTSVVDRNIAQAASKSLRKYVTDKKLTGIVIATCHRDILPFLRPDWIIDTDAGMFVIEPKECLRLEPLVVEVHEVSSTIWNIYAQHHYLKADISPFARCYAAIVNNQPAAFYAVISYPSGTVRNAFRGHRLVTHPDYQGLGIGPRLADFVAAGYVADGKRFFAKTAHPRLGEYRERSSEWKATSKNKKYRKDVVADELRQKRRQRFVTWTLNPDRFTYSHEFIGRARND